MNVAKLMTVDDLKQIVLDRGAEFAVVMLYFHDERLPMQYVTYGTHPAAKVCASDLSEEISAWIDRGECKSISPATGPAQVNESFKLDAAKNKAENERLRKSNADLLTVVCMIREAAGVAKSEERFGEMVTEIMPLLLAAIKQGEAAEAKPTGV